MTESCDRPILFETLVDYLIGALAEAEAADVESHLFQCQTCFAQAERLSGIQTAITAAVPPVVSSSRFATLERAGRVEHVNPMVPGQTAEVSFPSPGRLLVHRLSGMNLRGVGRIDVDLQTATGESLWRIEEAPFDPARGEILVACQAHFAGLFPDDLVLAAVKTVSGGRSEEIARYTIQHRHAGAS